MAEKRLYTIRPADSLSSLIQITEHAAVVVEEICVTCHKQGIISRTHPDSEEHMGSPSFKPFKVNPTFLREMADALEKEQSK